MRNTLICTVGTSLFRGNLDRLNEETHNKPENWKEIIRFYKEKNFSQLAKELLKIAPTSRLVGAEINTIEEARKKKWLKIENLIFLVSDTDIGRETGKLLKYYFENRKDIHLKNEVEICEIEKLQDPKPNEFKTKGLRNLVKEIGKYIDKYGIENCAIDATGGYKAQIAVAVLIGQALNIPIYYKHEYFNEIIDFPPLPVAMNYDLLGENADLFVKLSRNDIQSKDEIEISETLKVFIDEIDEDNEKLYALNALGEIYYTSFRMRFKEHKELKLCDNIERKPPTFRDDHYPKGFTDFVNKVWDENKWIKTCWSLDYSGQKGIKGVGFKRTQKNDDFILIGTYQDKDNFGAKFQIVLCDEAVDLINQAAIILNEKYAN